MAEATLKGWQGSARRVRLGAAIVVAVVLCSTAKADGFGMTPEQFWHTPFGVNDWIPFVGDVDGDGRADLIAVQMGGDGDVAVSRTSAIGKPLGEERVISGFGRDAVAAACVNVVKGAPPVFVGIFGDGSVKVGSEYEAATRKYKHVDHALKLPAQLIPKAPVRTVVADFEGNGRKDVLILDATGRLLLLKSEKTAGPLPLFSVSPIGSRLPDVRQFSAGIVKGVKAGEISRAQCVWLDSSGTVFRAFITSNNLGTPTRIAKASPDDHMVVGRFRGATLADVIIGQTLLPGGDSLTPVKLNDLPTLDVAKGDGPWCAGDVTGNGKDDLIRYRRTNEGFTGNDTVIHFSFDSSDPDKGFNCSAHDGLPDCWKRGKIKPGGLDLAKIGCHVGHRDILLQLERFDNVDENHLKEQMDAAVKYYASLPIVNPDGKLGIDLHVLYQTPHPARLHDQVLSDFDGKYPPVEVRGIVHSAFAENNGPNVSKINGDNCHFNGNWKEFVHEFGHQLDLDHSGHWQSPTPAGCALYPSLMSYSYSYMGGPGVGNTIGYSDGKFSKKIDDRHLSKHVMAPIDKLTFLQGDPYNFRLKADPDGKSTWVDWNWDGLFYETDVAADIHYVHGSDLGRRSTIGKTPYAPVLVTHGEGTQAKLLLFCGQFAGGKSRVVMRTWLGVNRETEGDKWSDEISLDDGDVTSDPTATYLGDGETWLAYPTSRGTVLRMVTTNAQGLPAASPPFVVPKSLDAEPTLVSFRGQLVLLLWHGPKKAIGLIQLKTNKAEISVTKPEISLGITSKYPVAAVEGGLPDPSCLWVDRMEDTEKDHLNVSQLVRLVPGDSGFTVVERKWLEGRYASHRPTLLWRREPGLLPDGRLYHICGGISNDQFITINTPYADIGGGWFIRRYLGPDFKSESAVGACFFQGDIAYAIRRHEDSQSANRPLEVAFYASGAVPYPMGDFDDIGHIRDFGLEHSIPLVSK